MRRLIQTGVAAIILALVARTWLVQGIVDPLVVSGGSMAPALLGAHRHVTCDDCAFAFDVGEESLPADLRAVCPNCGAENDLTTTSPLSGQRLVVDRAAYTAHGPERWDVVVLHAPDDPRQLSVKRVVGLPGETVELRGGDVFIDGRLAQRSLPQVLTMAVIVHQASCRPAAPELELPTPGRRDRWRPEGANSAWKRSAAGYECSLADLPADADWLVYQHQQTHGHAGHIGPILDDLGYNQNERRELVEVPDVILKCRLAARRPGSIYLRADDGRKSLDVEIDVETGSGLVRGMGEQPARFSAGSRPLDAPTDIVLALVDGQLRLTLGGKLLVECVYDPAGLERRGVSRPLAVGSTAASLTVAELEVLRDVYYLSTGTSGGVSHRLDADEYWLLGDNSAASLDSRQWPAVRGNLFVGKVLILRPRR